LASKSEKKEAERHLSEQ